MPITAVKVTASVALMPNKNLLNAVAKRATIRDRNTPAVTPIVVSFKPDFKTMYTTWERDAPRVMRTPISCVRCATAYAITPSRKSAVTLHPRIWNVSLLWCRRRLRHFRCLLRGFRLFKNFSVKEVDGPLGMLGETGVVRNHADGRAFAMQALQQFHHGFAIPGIQVSGWFVRQQDAG